VSADGNATSFERWALLGAIALALVGFAAFRSRHSSPTDDAGRNDTVDETNLLRVRIGGRRRAQDSDAPSRSGQAGGQSLGGTAGRDLLLPDPPPRRPDPPHRPDGAPSDVAPPATRVVIVRAGETLGQIVQRELGTASRIAEIVRLNGIDDPDAIREGAELLFPVE